MKWSIVSQEVAKKCESVRQSSCPYSYQLPITNPTIHLKTNTYYFLSLFSFYNNIQPPTPLLFHLYPIKYVQSIHRNLKLCLKSQKKNKNRVRKNTRGTDRWTGRSCNLGRLFMFTGCGRIYYRTNYLRRWWLYEKFLLWFLLRLNKWFNELIVVKHKIK